MSKYAKRANRLEEERSLCYCYNALAQDGKCLIIERCGGLESMLGRQGEIEDV